METENMKNENNPFIDKFVLYIMAIVFPLLALIVALFIDYGKNKDNLLRRIKLISLYEIFEIIIIGISFIYWGYSGIKVSVLVLFFFYIFVCAVVAYKKKDYISRGIAIGAFANHYSLAIMQTSKDSTHRIDQKEWPDSGLAVILMIFKILFILLLLFPVNTLVNKMNQKQPVYAIELSENIIEEIIPNENIFLETIPIKNNFEHKIYFTANINTFAFEDFFISYLQNVADEMQNILTYRPDQLFIITGYAADVGDKEELVVISRQRADIVRDTLVEFGVPFDNLVCEYFGGTNKWGNNLSEETMKQNRVVTIELQN